MADENPERFDDPPPRPVSLRWVWPNRWHLVIGDTISAVLTGAELGALADAAAGAVRGGAGGPGGNVV